MKGRKPQKLNSRGFTLIELIVCIAVLAIISVPIFQAFILSAKTTGKASQKGSATLAAQNIYEQIQSAGYEYIFPSDPDSTTSPKEHIPADEAGLKTVFGCTAGSASIDLATETETISMKGISVGGRTYDAVVKLDPKPLLEDDPTQTNDYFKNAAETGVNDRKMTLNTSFKNVLPPNSAGMDTRAENEAIKDYPGAVITGRSRAIAISFSKEEKDSVVKFTPEVAYTYFFSFVYEKEENGKVKKFTGEKTVTETDTGDAILYDPDKPFRLWFFYLPYYEGTSAGTFNWQGATITYPTGVKDLFLIDNSDKINCEVCLVKQSAGATSSNETAYGAEVRLYEPSGSDDMTVWTNMDESVMESKRGQKVGGPYNFRRYSDTMNYLSNDISSEGFIRKLKKDRLCGVTIEIYRKDHADTDEALAVLTGEKLG